MNASGSLVSVHLAGEGKDEICLATLPGKFTVNFEHKKLFPGDIGPPTGEMGTAMFWSEPNHIFNQTLLKMAPKLAEEGYIG